MRPFARSKSLLETGKGYSGRADASMTSNTEAGNLASQYPELRVVPVTTAKNPTPIAMLVPRGDQQWINFVNTGFDCKVNAAFLRN